MLSPVALSSQLGVSAPSMHCIHLHLWNTEHSQLAHITTSWWCPELLWWWSHPSITPVSPLLLLLSYSALALYCGAGSIAAPGSGIVRHLSDFLLRRATICNCYLRALRCRRLCTGRMLGATLSSCGF